MKKTYSTKHALADPDAVGSGYRKTSDCIFPDCCTCDDCKENYGIKKTSYEVDNHVMQQIMGKS